MSWLNLSCVEGICAAQHSLKVMLYMQHSAEQQRPGHTWVNCYVERSLLDVQWSGQDHYISPLEPHTVHLSQRYFKLQIILVNC